MSDIEIKKFIAQELNNGVNLSHVQDMVAEKFGVKYTFFEMRMLAAELENVDWKKLDPEPPKAKEEAPAAAPAPGTGVCKVERSKLARPGALASGTVIFGSGATAEWILDQTGRLGLDKLVGEPTEEDFQEFQTELKKLFANGL